MKDKIDDTEDANFFKFIKFMTTAFQILICYGIGCFIVTAILGIFEIDIVSIEQKCYKFTLQIVIGVMFFIPIIISRKLYEIKKLLENKE
jgi:hypothetical protein